MNKKAKIDKEVLLQMQNFLDVEKQIGQIAYPTDLLFITDGAWLKDTAVIDVINKNYSGWYVALVFAHYKDPLKLLVRFITSCLSEAKASAFYMRKEAAKDGRGTLNVSIADLHLCDN